MKESQIHLVDATSGGRIPAAPQGTVLHTSADAGWHGITVELHRIGPDTLPEHYVQGHRLTIHAGAPTRFEYRQEGRWKRAFLRLGDVCLQTHGALNTPRWHDEFVFLAVALDPAFVARAFADDVQPGHIRFQERRGVEDPFLAQLAATLRREIETPTFGGPLYGESLGVTFATHLLETYGVGDRLPAQPTGRLSSMRLRRVLDRIHDGLLTDGDAELSLEDLAAEAYLSLHHFARLFKSTTGFSPHQYVLRARVERAQQLMCEAPARTLTAIGLDAGFYDQAHFSRVFKRVLGVSPRQYAQAVR